VGDKFCKDFVASFIANLLGFKGFNLGLHQRFKKQLGQGQWLNKNPSWATLQQGCNRPLIREKVEMGASGG
jgi:hypothetical protein